MVKAVKIIVGVLASLFVLLHVIEFVSIVMNGGESGPLAVSTYMGHVIGIAIGLLVAILCFRKNKPSQAKGSDEA